MKKNKSNYLNNKDLLEEIRKSKLTFCEFYEDNCERCDVIVDVPKAESRGKKVRIENPSTPQYAIYMEQRRDKCLDENIIMQAKVNKANRLSKEAYESAMEENYVVKPTKKDYNIDPNTLATEDLVIRFHTFEYIPLLDEESLKDNPVTETDYREKVGFVPFVHYKYVLENGKAVGIREVGRSHHKDGEFDNEHGDITPKLANMFILLTNKYAQKYNWRGYTYVDDMKGNALLQLSSTGLQFNEARSDNPFAYLTTTLRNAFLRVLQAEKKEQDIRDDLFEKSGQTPSNTRQLEHEEYVRSERERFHNNEK